MRRALLFIAGGRMPQEYLQRVAEWWSNPDASAPVAVVQAEGPGSRIALFDMTSGEKVTDTDDCEDFLVMQHPDVSSPDGLAEALGAAVRLGATPEVLAAVAREFFRPKDGDPEDRDG